MLGFSREKRDELRKVHLRHHACHEERWAFYPFSNTYLVSTEGRVKNYATGNILTAFPNQQGYMMLNIILSTGERRCVMVHRLVAETFFGYVFHLGKYFYEVNHINGNKKDNTIHNLEWLTRQENLQHARDMRLCRPPSPRWKLSIEDVKDIAEFINLGFSQKEIAKSYNIDRNIITRNLGRLKC